MATSRPTPSHSSRATTCSATPSSAPSDARCRCFAAPQGASWFVRLLRNLQDAEFRTTIAGCSSCAGHTVSVGLGGNGQFSRLSALDVIGGQAGDPWHGSLLEDYELSLHLMLAGYEIRYAHDSVVAQEAVPTLPALVKQRTRWCQGGIQCLRYQRQVADSPHVTPAATVEMAYFLTTRCRPSSASSSGRACSSAWRSTASSITAGCCPGCSTPGGCCRSCSSPVSRRSSRGLPLRPRGRLEDAHAPRVRPRLLALLLPHPRPLRVVHRINEIPTTIALLAASDCAALLPRHTISDTHGTIGLHTVDGLRLERHVEALVRPERLARPAVRAVLARLRELATATR